jgi:hypothetical protein
MRGRQLNSFASKARCGVKKYETIATMSIKGSADAVWNKNENEQECEKCAEIPFSVAMKPSGARFRGGPS